MYVLIDQPGSRPHGLFRQADPADNSEAAASVSAAEPTDPDSLEALYRTSYRSLYAYVRSRTIGDEEAADLTQQVYLQVLAVWERRPAGPAGLLP